jgi:radical SAM superfamily enzyme YgiQ (UPF0313 family)
MKILLYNPDNGVTRNFMPHLWMFLLKALTPAEHEVMLIDGNAQAMDEAGIAQFVREQKIDLVGIGAMTRMIAKAYRIADAVRATGVPVVMGGPHVTEVPDEALGKDGGPRHADAVALGEADQTWPLKITSAEAQAEVRHAWTDSYSSTAIGRAVDSLSHRPLWLPISLLIGRLSFRGIYFPQMGRWAWMKVAMQNRKVIFNLVRAGFNLRAQGRTANREAAQGIEPALDNQEA